MSHRFSHDESVILVHIYFPAGDQAENLNEFKELASSAGAKVVEIITGTRKVPSAKYFVGSGKAEEIARAVSLHKTSLVLFNHVLTPAQERNLERLIGCRVVDRTGLILDIFAARARSFEGKLQVELALLHHLSSRLVRIWTHLERQQGGIGLRGPGETQIEVDRRLIRKRIKVIHERLKKLRAQREENRRSRKRSALPTIALVGYTNAGKSSLFNLLSGAETYTANQLFATLDPTLRRCDNTETGSFILADTVGFIRHLPHHLVEAFQATLEEVSEADLLLHIIDAHDPEQEANVEQVEDVLHQLKAEHIPCLEVHNKIDLCDHLEPRIEYNELKLPERVYISVKDKQGIPLLLKAIAECLGQYAELHTITLKPEHGKLRAQLHQKGFVKNETFLENGSIEMIVYLPIVEYLNVKKELDS